MAAKLFSQKEITLADALEHGLTEAEYQQICAYLGGRSPTDTELGIYSGLWSEHCSYKNSILQLKTLPTKSRRTLTSAGEENAGALDDFSYISTAGGAFLEWLEGRTLPGIAALQTCDKVA